MSFDIIEEKSPSIFALGNGGVSDRAFSNTVEADVYGNGIKMWLLSQGRRVKVTSPEDFVDEMKKEVSLMMKNYNEQV